MKYTAFHEARFNEQVNNALVSVKRILDTNRNPRLAHNDPDHQYEDKYALAALLTNTALVSHMTALEHLGVTSEHLETMGNWVHNDEQAVTMRFEAVQTCKFLQEKEVEFVNGNTTHTTETERTRRFPGFGKSHEKEDVKNKVTTMVKEYHWKVRVNYKLIAFAGPSPDGGEDARVITLHNRDATTVLFIKGTEKVPFATLEKHNPIDVNMTWFLQQIAPEKKICKFAIDRSDSNKCKTPRRNAQVDQAVAAFQDLCGFADRLRHFLRNKIEKDILGRHAPAAPTFTSPQTKTDLKSINADTLYNPILPLLERTQSGENGAPNPNALVALSSVDDTEESPLLSMADMDKFLGEQMRTIDRALQTIREGFPAADAHNGLISTAEANLVLMCCHLEQLGRQYQDSVDYIEDMLKNQLVQAIGKEVQSRDFDQFVSYYYRNKFYGEAFAPHPFCFAIRRPGYYPEGVLSIEKADPTDTPANAMKPVETFTRRIPATESAPPIRVPLNAATTVELTGDKYLHGWIQYRFSNEKIGPFQLGARARQFSCFLVMVGSMAGADRFEPKDAIVLQNKDEVLIPLLLNELPTAKEFKDAISSMSPEQQRFAKKFREMQLESSVFGVCVVQLKPQLEDLLGLPPGGLTKEMQLTQDLLSLFIDYQIPSDLLCYDGPAEEESRAKKVALVKEYTKSVLDVIKGEKEKQLQEARDTTTIKLEKEIQALKATNMTLRVEAGHRDSDPNDHHRDSRRGQEGRARRNRSFGFGASVPEAAVGATGLANDYCLEDAEECDDEYYSGEECGEDGPGSDFSPYVLEEGGDEPELSVAPAPTLEGGGGVALKPAAPHMPTTTTTPEDTSSVAKGAVVDFTKIPKQLDAKFEVHDSDNSLRATIIKSVSHGWTRCRQESLLTKPERKSMNEEEIRSEKDKAFDLLDALSRSGSLPLKYTELHVVVAVTHCFENDVMGTVIQDNINPIEKVEKSSLLMASTVHGTPAQTLLQNEGHVERLKGSFPALFDGQA